MYNPESYLTKELVQETLLKFQWPIAYTIESEPAFDSVYVYFPKCHLTFTEGFESEINLYVSNPNDPSGPTWLSFELINYIFHPKLSRDPNFKEPEYINGFHPFASKQKVIEELYDLCLGAHVYIQSCILGDFSFKDDIERLRYVKDL